MKNFSGREGAIERALQYFDDGTFEAELSRRVAYRTESQKPDSQSELHRYLDEKIIPSFEAMGFRCRKYDNPLPGDLRTQWLQGGNLGEH